MEVSSNDEGDKRGEVYQLYSPCHYVNEFLKTILKCLGFDCASKGEDSGQTEETEDRSIGGVLRRRPARPPIDAGGGGQHD